MVRKRAFRKRRGSKDASPVAEPASGSGADLWFEDAALENRPFADLMSKLRAKTGTRPEGSGASPKGKKPKPECQPDNALTKKIPKKNVISPDNSSSENTKRHKTAPLNHSKSGVSSASSKDAAGEADNETRLFMQAMEGVTPLNRGPDIIDPASFKGDAHAEVVSNRLLKQEQEAAEELRAIVQGKKEIPVEYTPEYVEGPVINSNPRLVRKLRRGKFSVQSYCDLHGLTAREALEWCEEFMARSVASNRSCVAIIHGRGLSSPRGPVLKKLVQEWLTTGRWRRHVIAYSSAPNWDGGPGVTYVLLRQNPAPRKRKKKPRLW